MPDLTTTYLGLTLRNPLVASASPLSKKLDSARRLDEAGVGAIVLYSLFEEQLIHESLELDHFLTRGTDSFSEAQSTFPDLGNYAVGPGKYLDHLVAVKKSVSVPVIGSLNGVSRGGWTRYARAMQDAGADAVELNVYYLPVDPNIDAAELEDAYVDLVGQVAGAIDIPLAVKLSPYLTALPNLARRMAAVGAKGLVLFNRFYQPDLDIEALEIVHTLALSTSAELRLPLRWVALLYGQVDADLALTGGVRTGVDLLKAMMAGARVAMVASELLRNGIERAGGILAEVRDWMTAHEYESIAQMQGSLSQKNVREPAALERANYMKVLGSFTELP